MAGVYPPSLNLGVAVATRDGDSAEARKLARGDSFSVSSGRRTYESPVADARGTVKAATSMTVTFSRVP